MEEKGLRAQRKGLSLITRSESGFWPFFNAFQGQGRVTIEGIKVKEAHKGVGGGYKRDLKR